MHLTNQSFRLNMRFRFFLSDPHGAIELSPEDLEQPFRTSPAEKHFFLTLEDYFGALQKFILSDNGDLLHTALRKYKQQDVDPDNISEIAITSEKHGAFYHIASITLGGLEPKVQFAVTTALSASARASLLEEYFIIQKLMDMCPDFLPELYGRKTLTWQAESGTAEFLMVLGEWLAGYHEWHLSYDPAANTQLFKLWDYDKGFCFLSEAESVDLLRQAAYILTYYYDQASFRQIYPWHHGAGDFVVKAETGAISAKLITARQYEPLVHFEEEKQADRLVAAIQFLLNLCLRMRLDRLDGVDGPAWIDDFAVQAAIEGFFAGLQATSATNRLLIGPPADFLEILQAFESREIADMYESLLYLYAEEDEDDFRLIQAKLPEHALQLYTALQSFSLEKN